MATQEAYPHFADIVLFLGLAGLLIPILAKLRVNQVLGFLAAGVIAGPFGLGRLAQGTPWIDLFTFSDPKAVEHLAEMGVVFLMFTIGLELSVQRLVALRHWVFGVGSLQIVVTALVVAIATIGLGVEPVPAVVIGLVLSFSSTAVVMQLLRQRNELTSPMGRSVFSVLLMQDLAVVPLLVLLSALSIEVTRPGMLWLDVLWALGKAAFAAVAIYLVARKVLARLFFWLDTEGHADTFMALVLLAILGIAAATWFAGLSLEMGALLAGLLMAETEFRHRVSLAIEPFTGLLLGLFFMSVGMGIDLVHLTDVFLPVMGLALLLLLLKSVIAALALRVGGLSWPNSVEGGMLLGQGGEFAFVLVVVAIEKKFLTLELAQLPLLLVGITMFLTPLYARLAVSVATGLRAKQRPEISSRLVKEVAEEHGHAIIVGFGRVGQAVAAALDDQGIPTLVVERQPALVQAFSSKRAIFVGDCAQPEILEHLGIKRAAALVLTMDQESIALMVLKRVRALYPKLPIVARARDEAHARTLIKAGATSVVPETLEASLQLSGLTLAAVGIPDEAVERWVGDQREVRNGFFRD